MKNSLRTSKWLRKQVSLLWLCAVVLITPYSQRVQAQSQNAPASPCKVGVQAPPYGFWTWAPNSNVTVFVLSSHFEKEQIPYLLTPLQSWNAAAETSSSLVRFIYGGEISTPRDCENCLIIMRGKVAKKGARAADFHASSANSDRVITHGKILIDFQVTDPQILTNTVAHELGHNLGLQDCYTCKDHTTVMNAVNVGTGLSAPSSCDIAQVKAAYSDLKKRWRPLAKIPIDKGEEPVADDTPIIEPDK